MRSRPWSRDLLLTLVAAVCTFFAVPVLLTVVPVVAQQASGRPADAGLVTAFASGATVVAELFMPGLMTRHSPARLMSVALVLVGLASLGHIVLEQSTPIIQALAVLRGLGFGGAAVAVAVLVAELAPPGRKGQAIGNLGLAIGLPSVFAPSTGLLLYSAAGPVPVFGMSALVAFAGALAVFTVKPAPAQAAGSSPVAWEGARDLLVPVIGLALLTATFGGIVSFAPLALASSGLGSAASFLFVMGLARVFSRWQGGALSDRFGFKRIQIPGAVTATIALTILFLGRGEPATVVVSAALYGLGTGFVQTAGFVGMLERSGPRRARLASTMWNVAFDGGIAVGGLTLGLAAQAGGYALVFAALPLMAALSCAVLAFDQRAPQRSPAQG